MQNVFLTIAAIFAVFWLVFSLKRIKKDADENKATNPDVVEFVVYPIVAFNIVLAVIYWGLVYLFQ